MKAKTLLVGVVIAVILQSGNLVLSAKDHEGKGHEKVVGVWEIVDIWGENPQMGKWRYDNVQPSIIIFTNKYYSVTYVQGNEPRPLMPEDGYRDDLTPEQAYSVWRYYTSNSGKCKILPRQIKTYPMVALWPNFMEEGSERIYHYKFEGDHLLLSVDEDDVAINYKLKRLP